VCLTKFAHVFLNYYLRKKNLLLRWPAAWLKPRQWTCSMMVNKQSIRASKKLFSPYPGIETWGSGGDVLYTSMKTAQLSSPT